MMTHSGFKTVLKLSAALATLLFTTAGNAAIVIDDSAILNSPLPSGAAPSPVTWGSFDASGSDKLVVVVGARRNFGGPMSVNGVTYNGISMIEAVEQNDSLPSADPTTAIYYLDNPGAGGDIAVTYNARIWTPDSGVSALALSGTDLGVLTTSGDIGSSTSLNTTVDDTLVVAGSQNFENAATPVPQAPLVDIGATPGLGSGYQFVGAATNVTPTFSNTGATTVAAVFAAVAPAVPEPSTFVLGALGIVGLIAFRRRRNR